MNELDRLARLYGIEPHYFDVWGSRHEILPRTKTALLAALGVEVGSDDQIASELQRAEYQSWKRPLPPVIVCTQNDELNVELSLPAASSAETFEWRLLTENGQRKSGTFVPGELGATDRADLQGQRYERYRLALGPMTELGYHRLEIGPDELHSAELIVCPRRCYTASDAVGEDRVWGLSVQLYGLSSASSWGMGDFSDLGDFAAAAAKSGAALVGVNPLHSLFPAEPRHFSPYSPSSREFLNPLYTSIERLADLESDPSAGEPPIEPGIAASIENARQSPLVDYPTVARLKMPFLERAYDRFRINELDHGPDSPRAEAFRAFQQTRGPALRRHAVFEALHERFYDEGRGIWSWRDWPPAYRNCQSAEVAAFADAHVVRIEFFEYLQWQADEQLCAAQKSAVDGGMAFGLYCDLAVAVHPDGASTWSHPDAMVADATVGAPPDELAPTGQNWGLAPLSPVGLREAAYAPLIAALRGNMRHAGAVRIDHVMGLQRLYWIPRGMSGADGAYINYPFRDLLRIIALESQRNRCIVIGEDLGTVAEGFREALQEFGIFSYKVLLFEREADGSFKKPSSYPPDALVTASTHDLPTIAGFEAGHDIGWRERLGHENAATAAARSERAESLAMLNAALGEPSRENDRLSRRAQGYLAGTPSRILMIQMEDLLGELEQPNLPGTFDEHPNWQRKLSMPLEQIFDDEATRSLFLEVAAARANASEPG